MALASSSSSVLDLSLSTKERKPSGSPEICEISPVVSSPSPSLCLGLGLGGGSESSAEDSATTLAQGPGSRPPSAHAHPMDLSLPATAPALSPQSPPISQHGLTASAMSAQGLAVSQLTDSILLPLIMSAAAATAHPSLLAKSNLIRGAIERKKFKCGSCSAAFSNKGTLEAHIKSYCVSAFAQSSTSSNERSASRGNDSPQNWTSVKRGEGKKYACEGCLASFSVAETLKTHLEIYCKARNKKISPSLSPKEPSTETENEYSGSRKRRSPSIDTVAKPTEKFHCQNCNIKFSKEDTLKIHETHYCTNEKSTNRESIIRRNKDVEKCEYNGESVICKLCDGPVEKKFVVHHMYGFHRIVGSVRSELMGKYCAESNLGPDAKRKIKNENSDSP